MSATPVNIYKVKLRNKINNTSVGIKLITENFIMIIS